MVVYIVSVDVGFHRDYTDETEEMERFGQSRILLGIYFVNVMHNLF